MRQLDPTPYLGTTISDLMEMVNRRMAQQADLMAERAEILNGGDHLTTCDWCDEYVLCRETATVHLLETEEDFCLRHFQRRLEEL